MTEKRQSWKSAQECLDSFFGKVGKPPRDLTRCQECDGKGSIQDDTSIGHAFPASRCNACEGTGVGQEEDE